MKLVMTREKFEKPFPSDDNFNITCFFLLWLVSGSQYNEMKFSCSIIII